MKIIITITYLFFACLSLMAQDAKTDFNTINRYYNTTENLAFDIKYELFLDGSTTPNEVETGKYVKQKKKYYTKQGNNEIIITDSYMFMIDRTMKILIADKKIDDKKLVNPLAESLDSLFLLYSKIDVLASQKPNTKGYRFYIKIGPYSSCDVYFNTKTNFVTEIINVFRDKIPDQNNKLRQAVLKTTYSEVNSLNTVFDYKNYITLVNKKYTLANPYKSFKFINHLN